MRVLDAERYEAVVHALDVRQRHAADRRYRSPDHDRERDTQRGSHPRRRDQRAYYRDDDDRLLVEEAEPVREVWAPPHDFGDVPMRKCADGQQQRDHGQAPG